MQNKTYIKVAQDALIEWTYDDSLVYGHDYSIIIDSLNTRRSYASNDASNDNNVDSQLFELDPAINKWGIADPTKRTFIQHQGHVNVPFTTFDKIRVYFPINYTFSGKTGFYLGISTLDYENSKLYWLANYYLDMTIQDMASRIEIAQTPIKYQERLWGKYIEFIVPSTFIESRKRTGSPARPDAGTINYNLTGGLTGIGLSTASPVILDFRFIEKKTDTTNGPVYTLSPKSTASVPQAPSYATVSVALEQATDGDYFNVSARYNNTSVEFADFMSNLESAGQRSYLVYSVTVFEENIPTSTVDYYVYKDFEQPISFRPILKFTNTTASIQVTMKLVNAVSGQATVKLTEYGLVPSEVLKYGRSLVRINLANAIKPKIYNAPPDKIVMSPSLLASATRRTQTATTTRIKLIPSMVSANNVVAKDITVTTAAGTFLGNDKLELIFTPFDNIIKLRIAKEITADAIQSFQIPANDVTVLMSFKSSQTSLDIPLYIDSQEIDLNNGVVIFMIKASDIDKLRKIATDNNRFYITIKNDLSTTVVYTGRFILSDSPEYIARTKTTVAQQNNTVKVETVNITPNNNTVVTKPINENVTVSTDNGGAGITLNSDLGSATVETVQNFAFTPSQYRLIF